MSYSYDIKMLEKRCDSLEKALLDMNKRIENKEVISFDKALQSLQSRGKAHSVKQSHDVKTERWDRAENNGKASSQ